jgi:hypothetical protein
MRANLDLEGHHAFPRCLWWRAPDSGASELPKSRPSGVIVAQFLSSRYPKKAGITLNAESSRATWRFASRYHKQEPEKPWHAKRPSEPAGTTAAVMKGFLSHPESWIARPGPASLRTRMHDRFGGRARHQREARGRAAAQASVRDHWVRPVAAGLCLASEASHYYSDFEQRRPFPIVCDVSEMLMGYDAMQRLASPLAHVVPGHDPPVLKRYPAQPGGTADIVRLDADPLA